jgi:hypothetical protein
LTDSVTEKAASSASTSQTGGDVDAVPKSTTRVGTARTPAIAATA